MKVLVTGAAGFIGSHVVDALCERGARVLALDSLDPQVYQAAPTYLNAGAEYCFTDLRHWVPDDRFKDVEFIVHLAALGGVGRAAREPANVIAANCAGTARLVDAASNWSGLRRIVLCSSFSIYGSNYSYRCESCALVRDARRREEELRAGNFEVPCLKCGAPTQIVPITEAATPDPLEVYGASKYMQELCFRGFRRAPLTTLRFSSVYGPRLRLDDGEATIIARLAGSIRAGQPPELFEDGRQIRDWVHVSDIVAVVTRLLEGEVAPPVINICSGVPTTLAAACNTIARAMGVTCEPRVVGGYRPGDMRHCLGDASTVEAVLGKRPVTLDVGARLTFSPPARS